MRAPIATLLLCCSLANVAFAAPALADSAAEHAGKYVLSDGRVLTVTEQNGRLFAQLATPRSTENDARLSTPKKVVLHPAGPGVYVSPSTPLQIRFDSADGDAVVLNTDAPAPTPAMARR